MDAIVLAAGYAIRLYPLTKNLPKPLLKVAGKPIVEHIINKLDEIDIVDKVYIVTNGKYKEHFSKWLHSLDAKKQVEIISDGTISNDNRLGALGDIQFTINAKRINNDLAVIAGDNFFEFSLIEVINLFKKRKCNIIALYNVKDLELAKHYGVVEVNNNIVVNFKEKPSSPKSTLVSTGVYLFPKKTIRLIKEYINQGNNTDKTGSFIEWLYKRDAVYAYIADKPWYDIGNIEQLEKAKRYLKKEK